MKQYNDAMLGKQSLRVVIGDNNLSVKMLEAKYAINYEGMKSLTMKPKDSPTWKRIAAQASLLAKGVGKNVVNGRSTLF